MNANEERTPKSPCVRCLIADLPDERALAEILAQRIAQLSSEERVPEAERLRRLACCRDCRHLNHGTCALCGCYVEIRAARVRMDCPDVPGRWPAKQNNL